MPDEEVLKVAKAYGIERVEDIGYYSARDLTGEWADRANPQDIVYEVLGRSQLQHLDGSSNLRPFGHASGQCEVCDWWDCEGTILDAYIEGVEEAEG